MITKVLFIFGTRPEAIKMAPLILELRSRPAHFDVEVCVTGQHREMLDQVTSFFGIEPEYDLDIMTSGQSLFDITAGVITGLEGVLKRSRPDLIFVQGDTTTAFVGSLAGYYQRVDVAHLEAGLRSGDKHSPYPEEMNRQLAGRLADLHFAPTETAAQNLQREGLKANIWQVGNTVIDALFSGLELIKARGDEAFLQTFSFLNPARKTVLVTGHRRESFGKPFEDICHALLDVVQRFDDVEVVYPVHLNPNVREPVNRILRNSDRIHLIEPLSYPELIWLMDRCHLVLTDSGGIQEEAPSLGKPVLVMREVTERVEGVAAGTALLVGRDRDKIIELVSLLLTDEDVYRRMSRAVNPYGDGKTSMRIADILVERRRAPKRP